MKEWLKNGDQVASPPNKEVSLFTPDTIDEIYRQATQDVKTLKTPLFNSQLNKLSLTTILLKTFFNYYYIKKVESGEVVGYNLFKRDLNNLTSRHGLTIAQYLLENKTATKPELAQQLGINHQSTNTIINKNVDMGILKTYGKVKPPYTTGDYRPPTIYGLIEATPEDILNAQRRYAKLNPTVDPITEIINKHRDRKWTKQTGKEVGKELQDNGFRGKRLTDAMRDIRAKVEGLQ